MQDAVAALESAISELVAAQQSLPEDLQGEIQEVIDHTRSVLEAVRAEAEPTSG